MTNKLNKKRVDYNLSEQARKLLEKLSEQTALDHTALVETAIRLLAETKGIIIG